MTKKIAFFDIDGTLTSEIDGSIPESVKYALERSRDNGNLLFINTGRCMQNVEERFRILGFDGYLCGCGTNIYVEKDNQKKEILHVEQPHAVIMEVLKAVRSLKADILFESKYFVRFDTSRDFFTEGGYKQYSHFVKKNYDMSQDIEASDFVCDKFVVWFEDIRDLATLRKVTDLHFECIDRGGNFREFVPLGYSKATGIQTVLDYYNIPLKNAFAFGDSNNDLAMLSYVPNSIAMGNSVPSSLFNQVSYVTSNASEDGIAKALEHFGFI